MRCRETLSDAIKEKSVATVDTDARLARNNPAQRRGLPMRRRKALDFSWERERSGFESRREPRAEWKPFRKVATASASSAGAWSWPAAQFILRRCCCGPDWKTSTSAVTCTCIRFRMFAESLTRRFAPGKEQ